MLALGLAASLLASTSLAGPAAPEPFPEALRQGVRFDNATDLELRLAENRRLLEDFQRTNGTVSNNCNMALNVPTCYQICDEWCWATVTTMTVDYYKGSTTCEGAECQVASREFGQQCCPYTNACHNSPTDPPNACNSGGTPQLMADAASFYTGGPFQVYGALPQANLDAALMSKRVVMILVNWQGGGGHALIVGGCNSAGAYALHDPWGWYSPAPPQWQGLSYGDLLRYPAPNGEVGSWSYSITWSLGDEAAHAGALRAADELRTRPAFASIAV